MLFRSNDTATTEIYTPTNTLSLHDALPISGFQRALARAGKTVPTDFSLIGVAAQHWAEEFHPQLTSADVPAAQMGASAVELLLERIATPDAPPRHLLLAPPISLRDSAGRAPLDASAS